MATSTDAAPKRYVSTREAAFMSVGAMVGAGIISLLGTAAEVAGSAVWLSFALAGGIAALQGYSFAKFGARYPAPHASATGKPRRPPRSDLAQPRSWRSRRTRP